MRKIRNTQKNIVAAFHLIAEEIEPRGKKRPRTMKHKANSSRAWMPDHDTVLVADYKKGKTIPALAKQFGRTKKAIVERLYVIRRRPDGFNFRAWDALQKSKKAKKGARVERKQQASV